MHDVINNIREKRRNDEGFTLIELLVVVVIIGVLVAIAVPVYLNYRKGAADKSAQSDVRGAISAVEQYYTENGNTLPNAAAGVNSGVTGGVTSLTLTGGGTTTPQTITLSDKTSLGFNPSGNTYTICGNNTGGSGKWYVYNSANGGSVKASTAATPSQTTC